MVRSVKYGTKTGVKTGVKAGVKTGVKYGIKRETGRRVDKNAARTVNAGYNALAEDAMSREEFFKVVENILRENNVPVAAPLSDDTLPDAILSDVASSDISVPYENGVEYTAENLSEDWSEEMIDDSVAEILAEMRSEMEQEKQSEIESQEKQSEIKSEIGKSQDQTQDQTQDQSQNQSKQADPGVLPEIRERVSLEEPAEAVAEVLPGVLPEARAGKYRFSVCAEKRGLHEHGGHRQRMKERVLGHGVESLADHEVLEVLLYYAVPRCDTNALAHRLLSVFGSLPQVLEADYKDLQRLCGISPNTAFLLKFASQLAGRYMMDKQGSRLDMSMTGYVKDYVRNLYTDQGNEVAYMLCLDARRQLLKTIKLAEGSIREVSFDTGEVVQNVLRHKARSVILVHNHPGGSMHISKSDFELTKMCMSALAFVNVDLLDHIVVCGRDSISFIEKRYMPALRQYVNGEIARKAKQ